MRKTQVREQPQGDDRTRGGGEQKGPMAPDIDPTEIQSLSTVSFDEHVKKGSDQPPNTDRRTPASAVAWNSC